ncbi:hypothetical protein [Aquabacterium sp.]|uniref:hypothetical protein n=1 Tax=Aquabacterium sp. TaxID=1872578 RepID=UPI0035AE7E9A
MNNPQAGLNLMLGLGLAPLNAASAYCSQLERGSPNSLQTHERAFARALNTMNSQLFSLGLDALNASRDAVRSAGEAGVPEAVVSATDSVLAQQEASLRETARKVVRMAYAY